jgi:exodeoxyribonuclease VII large subunit
LALYNEKLEKYNEKILIYINIRIEYKRQMVRQATARLETLNPTAILARGYSITRSLPDHRIVRAAGQTRLGALLEVQLARGRLRVAVAGVDEQTEEERHGEKNV